MAERVRRGNPKDNLEAREKWSIHQAVGVGVITLGALMLYSVLAGEGGLVTEAMSAFLRRCLGVGAFALPAAIIFYGVALIATLAPKKPARLLLAFGLIFVSLLTIWHLQAPPEQGLSKQAQWHYGGAIGAALAFVLRKGFSEVGSYIILSGLLLVALGIAAERPLAFHLREGLAAITESFRNLRTQIGKLGARRRRKLVASQAQPTTEAEKTRITADSKPAGDLEETIPPPTAKEIEEREFEPKFSLPSLELLSPSEPEPDEFLKPEIEANIALLEETLESFNIPARVAHYERGPAITRYEVETARGIRVTKVSNLADDLAMALAAVDVRVEAPIPGKSAIGIEVPNKKINFVSLRSVLETEEFASVPSTLKFALGKDIAGHPMVGDLARMPHLLIGGATNSGKSVCLNSIIASLLFNATPDKIRLILIDPKRVELTLYEDMPHLAAPIIHDAGDSSYVLRQAIKEMERRYRLFSSLSVKNIDEYNEVVRPMGREPLPYLIIIIDELADLMLQGHAEFERLICRLAQLARATGIHLVVATQRPTIDIVTGTIKANISSRIAFAVSSQVDSRTILDCNGAERLIGSGDMLYLPIDAPKPVRIQGAFISSGEIETLASYLRQQGEPDYLMEPPLDEGEEEPFEIDAESEDELFRAALDIVKSRTKISVSLLQRKLRIGFNRAARIIEMMEEQGIVGPADGVKPRQVLLGTDTKPTQHPEEEN